MEQDFNEKMKEQLLSMKKEILASLTANDADFRQIAESMEARDSIDIAADDIDRKMLETVGIKDYNRLKLIDSALDRIQQNKYGLCMKCGKKINPERLEAIPYALLCINCKTEEERKNR
ncbi:MAG: TraR/DksA family transcriptional regulator [Spirochaetaceae bacterium]|nr:TraR/DksA family transcriptional regulator [Spirochaetaceae bacterium]MBP5329008.1 TraR/DksA family transcriptional regulator [Spirochaetaceae bacterium]